MKSRFSLRRLTQSISRNRRKAASRASSRRPRLETLEDRRLMIVGVNGIPAAAPDFTGVVAVDMSGASTPNQLAPSCTGTLLSTGRHILTAAHCLTNDDTGAWDVPMVTVVFETSNGRVLMDVPSSSFHKPSTWDGFNQDGSTDDLAIITLPRQAPAGATRHPIYQGTDEVGRWFYEVGYGQSGFVGGGPSVFDGVKRMGTNFFDAAIGPNSAVLRYDLDRHPDDWAGAADPSNPSARTNEIIGAPGDSGGPLFLWGPSGQLEVAAVHSASMNNTDHHWGDRASNARVSSHVSWINGILAQSNAYDFVLNLNHESAGNNGAADTIELRRSGSLAEVLINGQVFHSDTASQIRSISVTGSNDQDVVIVSAGGMNMPIRVDGGAGDDQLIVRGTAFNDAATLLGNVITLQPQVIFAFAARVTHDRMDRVQIEGLGGSDSITADFTSGVPIPAGGLTVDGGAGSGTNQLTLQGHAFDQETYRASGGRSGEIGLARLAGSTHTIRYSNLDTINDTAGSTNGTSLAFHATGAANTINVVAGPTIAGVATSQINGAGGFATLNFANKFLLDLNAGGGADTITINDPNLDSRIRSLVVDGEDGDDLLTVEFAAGSPLPEFDLSFTGRAGNDRLRLQGNAYYHDTYVMSGADSGRIDLGTIFNISPPEQIYFTGVETIDDLGRAPSLIQSLGTRFNFQTTAGAEVMSVVAGPVINNVATTQIYGVGVPIVNFARKVQATINAGEGADTIYVTHAPAGTPLIVSGGGGDDAVVVGDAVRGVDNFAGAVTVRGDGHVVSDSLIINDRGSAAGQSYVVSSSRVVRGAAVVNYAGLERVRVNAGRHNDAFSLQSASVPGVALSLDGGAGADTLTGPSANNAWRVNNTNAGSVNGVTFSTMENLTGGPLADVFTFNNARSVSGAVSGGAGADTLNYAAWLTGVNVDLATGVATAAGQGVSEIENVVGGAAADRLIGNDLDNLLVGNASDDVLAGGLGRDVMIGGLGLDRLDGGDGEDLLIGGRTSHDGIARNLDAIMAEWTRTDLAYRDRIDHLLGAVAGGRNGGVLLTAATVSDDAGAADRLTGGGSLDWFFRDLNDRILDPNVGGPETVTVI
jgi:Ca2+-binding RTX toxin-like protein/secreted trypsin-like serine protease